jgi:hypothetical protein
MDGPGALDEPLDLGQSARGESPEAVGGRLGGVGEQVGYVLERAPDALRDVDNGQPARASTV